MHFELVIIKNVYSALCSLTKSFCILHILISVCFKVFVSKYTGGHTRYCDIHKLEPLSFLGRFYLSSIFFFTFSAELEGDKESTITW